ncbi:MAG TPA: sigma 54-interacting transcriptional regulator, partial [Blastocatellia bacterium]|nr:sigma 54-interacting transcriptional regulator [Blastocatellia bacterium]
MSDETAQRSVAQSRTDSGREDKMTVLVVDEDDSIRNLVERAMLERGYRVRVASSQSEAVEMAAAERFDLVFCEVAMDGLGEFDRERSFRGALRSATEIVLMAGQSSVEAAIEAVRRGANDYICKPFTAGVLQAIASAVEQRRYPNKLIEVHAQTGQQEVVSNSPLMIEVVKTATRVAPAELPVMIRGESGTGKELIARLIHRKSPRVERPFVAVNCGALPGTLLESELFGHARGAFAGAETARRGLFDEAEGGTLLLGEVTEASPSFQSKLLRVLQEGEFCPLGTETGKRLNVRVLSSTSRDPHALVEQGLF